VGFAVALICLYGATAATYAHNPAAAMYLPAGALVMGLGVFVLGRAPGARLNRAFALLCLCMTAWLAVAYLSHVAALGWGYERVFWAIAILRIGPILAPAALLHFTFEFLGKRGRVARLVVIAAIVSMLPFAVIDPLTMEYRLDGLKYVPSSTSYTVRGALTVFWLVVWTAITLREAARRTPTLRRSQCRTWLLGMMPSVIGATLSFLPAFKVQWFPSFLAILVATFPVFVGLAVLRYEMFDIKLVVRRTLPYAVMTGLIGAAYAMVVTVVHDYFHQADKAYCVMDLVALAVLVGMGFQPTLVALQRTLDKAFFRSEAKLDRYLADAGARYGAAAMIGEVADTVVEDVRSTLQLEWAAAFLGGDEGEVHSSGGPPHCLREAAPGALTSVPPGRGPISLKDDVALSDEDEAGPLRAALAETGSCLAVPLDMRNERGLLVCGEKRSHAPFTARDMTFIAAIASQAEGAAARIESRTEARQLRELSSAVLASLANSVALVDADGRIVTCNPIFRRTFGGEVGSDIRDLGLSALVGPAKLPVEVRTGGGAYIASGRRLEGEWGGPASLIVLTDVTELRRLQDEAGRREALAKIGSAVATINHEIMNVLSPVTMYLDAARRQCGTAEAKGALSSAQSRLAELRRLGDELRDYYLEPRLSPVAIRLADVVASCLRDLGTVAGDGWSPPELDGLDLTLRADPQKAKQVFLNILKNAWEAMAEAGRVAWSVSAHADGRYAIVAVRDSGPGIPPPLADRLFEPFFSTKKGSTNKGGGSGLGLAIARRIVEAHGGEIELSGEDDGGATARISWPLAPDA